MRYTFSVKQSTQGQILLIISAGNYSNSVPNKLLKLGFICLFGYFVPEEFRFVRLKGNLNILNGSAMGKKINIFLLLWKQAGVER